jgi:hypothetical protein
MSGVPHALRSLWVHVVASGCRVDMLIAASIAPPAATRFVEVKAGVASFTVARKLAFSDPSAVWGVVVEWAVSLPAHTLVPLLVANSPRAPLSRGSPLLDPPVLKAAFVASSTVAP